MKRLIMRIEHRDGTVTYRRLSEKRSAKLLALRDKCLKNNKMGVKTNDK